MQASPCSAGPAQKTKQEERADGGLVLDLEYDVELKRQNKQ